MSEKNVETNEQEKRQKGTLRKIIERREFHLHHPLFVEPLEWSTALTVEMGKIALCAEQYQAAPGASLDWEIIVDLRERLIHIAGLSLAWMELMETGEFSTTRAGLLARALEENYGPPAGISSSSPSDDKA